MTRIAAMVALMFALGCAKAHTDAAKPCLSGQMTTGSNNVAIGKAAVPEAPKDSLQEAAAALDKKITVVEHELDAKKHEPPPACHHCPLPPPKPDKYHRRKPRWSKDAAQMPLVVTTPQQFTDFMNKNLPSEAGSSPETPKCRQYTAPDGCNVIIECDGMPITETSMYCIQNPLSKALKEIPRPGKFHLSCTQIPTASIDGRIELDCTKSDIVKSANEPSSTNPDAQAVEGVSPETPVVSGKTR